MCMKARNLSILEKASCFDLRVTLGMVSCNLSIPRMRS